MSIRATYFQSGLPDFVGRSPAGLRANFHEFATLLILFFLSIIHVMQQISYTTGWSYQNWAGNGPFHICPYPLWMISNFQLDIFLFQLLKSLCILETFATPSIPTTDFLPTDCMEEFGNSGKSCSTIHSVLMIRSSIGK